MVHVIVEACSIIVIFLFPMQFSKHFHVLSCLGTQIAWHPYRITTMDNFWLLHQATHIGKLLNRE